MRIKKDKSNGNDAGRFPKEWSVSASERDSQSLQPAHA